MDTGGKNRVTPLPEPADEPMREFISQRAHKFLQRGHPVLALDFAP